MDPIDEEWMPLEEAVSRDLFRAEVHAWAGRIDVEPKEIHIRPMTRKWGSCSTAGRLTFNAELLRAPAEVRRRVMVEELLHLKVPNHGRLFKALLRAYLERPGYPPSPPPGSGSP
jgi:predicted metal-dependent hydrolase